MLIVFNHLKSCIFFVVASFQILSFVSSILSISVAASRLFFMQRNGIHGDVAVNFKIHLLVLPFIVILILVQCGGMFNFISLIFTLLRALAAE